MKQKRNKHLIYGVQAFVLSLALALGQPAWALAPVSNLEMTSERDFLELQHLLTQVKSIKTEDQVKEFNQKISGKIIYLNQEKYTLVEAGIHPRLYDRKVIEGIWALPSSGEKVLLRDQGEKPFFAIEEYSGTDIEGGSASYQTTLSRTGVLISPSKKQQIFQYGGSYLSSIYKDIPPITKSFDFNQIYFAHELRGFQGIKGVIDVFHHGLLPHTVTGRGFGDHLHQYQVSCWIKKGPPFGYGTMLLISVEAAEKVNVRFRIPKSKLGGMKLETIPDRVEVIPEEGYSPEVVNWLPEEVQTQSIPWMAFSALVIEEKDLEKYIELMRQGQLPVIPLYSHDGRLLNQKFLEEIKNQFVYSLEDPKIEVEGNVLKIEFTLFAGNWNLKNIIENLGIQAGLRYARQEKGEWHWSGKPMQPDLKPFAFYELGRTNDNGYRVSASFVIPENVENELQFVLNMRTQFGQELWLKNKNQNFEADILRKDQTTQSRSMSLIESSL